MRIIILAMILMLSTLVHGQSTTLKWGDYKSVKSPFTQIIGVKNGGETITLNMEYKGDGKTQLATLSVFDKNNKFICSKEITPAIEGKAQVLIKKAWMVNGKIKALGECTYKADYKGKKKNLLHVYTMDISENGLISNLKNHYKSPSTQMTPVNLEYVDFNTSHNKLIKHSSARTYVCITENGVKLWESKIEGSGKLEYEVFNASGDLIIVNSYLMGKSGRKFFIHYRKNKASNFKKFEINNEKNLTSGLAYFDSNQNIRMTGFYATKSEGDVLGSYSALVNVETGKVDLKAQIDNEKTYQKYLDNDKISFYSDYMTYHSDYATNDGGHIYISEVKFKSFSKYGPFIVLKLNKEGEIEWSNRIERALLLEGVSNQRLENIELHTHFDQNKNALIAIMNSTGALHGALGGTGSMSTHYYKTFMFTFNSDGKANVETIYQHKGSNQEPFFMPSMMHISKEGLIKGAAANYYMKNKFRLFDLKLNNSL